MSLPRLHVQANRLHDAHGRQVLLRGVNLGGDSKVPVPLGGTQYPSDFADHRDVSFIGRPFPLDQALPHFQRIRRWGFNALRLLTTWEAVEHAGPGLYDDAYLDFLAHVCRLAGEQGLYVFIDFHQDVWSRMSGGDGAPGWTFESVGLDFTRFDRADAAHVMQHRYQHASAQEHQAAYPAMSWSQNYRMPANGVMWTLFWAGRRITPDFRVGGVNVQDYLQGHLLGAMSQVAARVAHLPHVVGFDTLNEPGIGWLGQDLSPRFVDGQRVVDALPLPGPVWSPLEALAVARGLPTRLPLRGVDPATGRVGVRGDMLMNASGVSIWRDSAVCPFEQAGIYGVERGRAVALQEQAFSAPQGQVLDIVNDAFGPYFHSVARTIRQHRSDWLVLAEIDPFGPHAGRRLPQDLPPQSVNAGHWYDLSLLVHKHFDIEASPDLLSGAVAQGPAAIGARYRAQLEGLRRTAPDLPLVLGEFGTPFDLDDGAAYSAWRRGERGPGVWRAHSLALGLMYDAIDALQIHSMQWNYTAGNRNQPRVGDQWNQEDLSIFSVDQVDDPQDLDAGGRGLEGCVRPSVQAVQGRLLSQHFDAVAGVFNVEIDADPQVTEPTVIMLPLPQFPAGVEWFCEGALQRQVHEPPLLRLWAGAPGRLQLTCRRQ